MENLKRLLKEKQPTEQDIETFYKVQEYYRLCDLDTLLNADTDAIEQYTPAEREQLDKNIDTILYKYDKYLDYDWETAMLDAIYYTLKDN